MIEHAENRQPPHASIAGMSGISHVDGDCDTPGNLLKVWGFVYDGDGVKVKQVYTEGASTLTTYYYAGGSYEVQTDGTTESVKQYYSVAGMTFVPLRGICDHAFRRGLVLLPDRPFGRGLCTPCEAP